MSLEAWGDGDERTDSNTDGRVEEAFRDGLRSCREYMARFVEQGGDATTAASIRANWNPWWGTDEGPCVGDPLVDPWGNTQRDMERSRERLQAAMAEATARTNTNEG